MSIFAENVARLTKRHGQGALAKAVGVSQSTVSRWTAGAEVKAQTVERLASFLGCSVEQLLNVPCEKWEEPEEPSSTPREVVRYAPLNAEALIPLLSALLPYGPKGRWTESDVRLIAQALAYGLELLPPDRASQASSDAYETAARGAVSRFRDLVGRA